MSEEKEIKVFKPSGWLYVFLFIYYSIWLLQGFGAVSHYYTFGFDEFQKYGLVEWLCFPVFLLAALYSLYAVIKTLRGDADCITALKWSLVITFLYTGFNETRGQIATYNVWVWCVAFFARPLFYLIFYLYLCFAKGVKRRYPKKDRRFSPSGRVWTGILMLFLAIGVFALTKEYKVSQYCKQIDSSLLNLKKGEVSDGFIVFNSNRKWEEWLRPSDTLWIEDRIETIPTLMSSDSTSLIYLSSGKCPKPDARTHNQIIVASLNILRENELNGDLHEMAFNDTIVNSNKLMATSFKLEGDSIQYYFTVMHITDGLSPKCGVFVRIDKDGFDSEWPVNFAKGIRFGLQNITKGKDNENSYNSKYSHSYGIGDSNNYSYSNLFPSFHNGIFPRFFVCVVNAKNCEGEIAYSKCYKVFKNL